MARYTGPRLKIIRRLGTSIPGLMRTDPDLRRPYPPGQHGPTKRKKLSDYALRLMEKQKLRFHYGLSERQLRRYVAQAFAGKGNSGHTLLQLLERRLDNVVFRAGFAPTMAAARQMVLHRHVTVNGKRVNIPSYQMRAGDSVQLHDKSKMKPRAVEAQKDPNNLKVPDYLEAADGVAKVKMLPERDSVPVDLDPQLIVEYYSGK
ncbi:MAG: 30S ribosomal protein S4 [Deltaproteobacteria bacterium RBG_16_71_12]|nr:MAG: 30S ribosomal protein S4 [Deltaproteobacteria bacterium RBG_16_71_12]